MTEPEDRTENLCPHLRPLHTEECPYCAEIAAKSITHTAYRLTHGERNKDYGSPLANHGRTAHLWSVYKNINITPEDVCMMNILQKISRAIHSISPDTLVDIAGYAENISMIKEERDNEISEDVGNPTADYQMGEGH